jgi:hypothetical protein
MSRNDDSSLPRASRWEIVGAWLHIWTPGRGTYVPPVPVGRLLAALVAAVVACTALAVAVANWKERAEERDRAASAAADGRIRVELAREQTPHRARLDAVVPSAATAAGKEKARQIVLDRLESAITADARQRHASGTLPSRVERTGCVPYVRPRVAHPPSPSPTARRASYECLAVTSDIEPTARTVPGELGYPFWARVDFRTGKVVWCKVSPRAAERGIGGDLYVALDRDCDLARG